MTVRLIKIGEVEVGMTTLEHDGRAKVIEKATLPNGFYYRYRHLEGAFAGKEGSHEAVPSSTVWIEEGTGMWANKDIRDVDHADIVAVTKYLRTEVLPTIDTPMVRGGVQLAVEKLLKAPKRADEKKD